MCRSTEKILIFLFSLDKSTHSVFHTAVTSLDKGVLSPRILTYEFVIEVKGLEHLGLDALPYLRVFLV